MPALSDDFHFFYQNQSSGATEPVKGGTYKKTFFVGYDDTPCIIICQMRVWGTVLLFEW